MSTWQMFSDAGNSFRWEASGQIFPSKPSEETDGAPIQLHNSISRLPSMADLLLQGCSKLLENGDEDGRDTPMFRTGSGKSVVLKQSSIKKALSVLGNDDAIPSGQPQARDGNFGFSNSVFCTGSGKSVTISSAGLVRAKTLLGLEEDNKHSNSQCFQLPRKSSIASEQEGWQNLLHSERKETIKNDGHMDESISTPFSMWKNGLIGSQLINDVSSNMLQPDNSAPKTSPMKFHTAGGRSLSVSSEALKRARSLLGDPDLGSFLDDGDAMDPVHSVFRESGFVDASFNKEKDFCSSFTHPATAKSKRITKNFISPLKSSSKQVQSYLNSENIISRSSLIKEFDAVANDSICGFNNGRAFMYKSLSNGKAAVNALTRSSHGPLVDISNTISATHANNRHMNNEKRGLGRGSSVSPFKRPRNSKFITPLNRNGSIVPSGLSTVSCESSCRRKTVSTRYPFQVWRRYIKEYFRVPFLDNSTLEQLVDEARRIKADNADKYMFCDESDMNCIGAEAFYHLLIQHGASEQYISKEWVTNHYKWIVWKLACYERFHPVKSAPKFLTVWNVLEELKYRYEREANHGHHSAIKRILEGDTPPSSMMVLCISTIHVNSEPKTQIHPGTLNGSESSNASKVELTDGWYSIDAFLDAPLAKHLAAGKLFVGQKLRIWGAGLCGWVGPVSPFEASGQVSLLLHINGTYRAHWADRLGFCKVVGAPLAFRCIKSNGGPVPRTLVGVTRIYPVLYKEKLSNGGSVVRSEKMEVKMMQMYNQRRSAIVDGIASEFQREMKGSCVYNDNESEEGAKILKILETAAEPEVLMAEMSPEQLTSFASYQAKVERMRQLDMEKAIKKALQDAGLSERDITPFMRVRVVGLTTSHGKCISKEGLITIWNPTEKQKIELVEGQAYDVAGLLPVNSNANTLYLQARGTSTKWQPLSPLAIQHFQSFFNPRVSVPLSNMGEVPLCSEFDIAAYVVYVGEVYMAAQQRKQWLFVTDGSNSMSKSQGTSDSLLAISFCLPFMDDDLSAPINYNLAGSIVGFCNLIKRAKDQTNHLWIAEATENSTYSLNFDSPNLSHLKNVSAAVQSWAKISGLSIDTLKEKVLFIVGDRQS